MLRIDQGAYISIHAPLTGSDQKASEDVVAQRISIHAPLTGSDTIAGLIEGRTMISIHAPLTGSDGRLQ